MLKCYILFSIVINVIFIFLFTVYTAYLAMQISMMALSKPADLY